MRVLTSIGEMGVQAGDRYVKFRPSLLAMSRIGSPLDIVSTFVAVYSSPPFIGNKWLDEPLIKRWRKAQFRAALTVLHCCAEEDVFDLVGYYNERYRYVPGRIPMDDIVGLAIGLLKHGILGDAKTEGRPIGKNAYLTEFNARDFVASAMAHLGATEEDAWSMTMTSFVAAMRSKYPLPDGADAPPTEEEHDYMMNWLEKVKKARANG